MRCFQLLIVGSLLAAVAGCKQHPRNLPTVVVDEWWSRDYALSAGLRKCRNVDGLSAEYCNSQESKDEYRQEEANFTEDFSTAFQADTACSGATLAVYKGHGDTSRGAEIMAGGGSFWAFQVNFQPGAQKQSWSMDLAPRHVTSSSGEGTASSIAHMVCSIVNRSGGSVAE
jgi:hypothetical protein